MRLRLNKNKKNWPFILLLAFSLLSVLGYIGVAAAEDSLNIKTIKSVPGFSSQEANLERAIENHYQIIGTLDFIGDGYVVVDDSEIKTAPKLKISGALKGKHIGVRLNDRNEAVKIQKIDKRK